MINRIFALLAIMAFLAVKPHLKMRVIPPVPVLQARRGAHRLLLKALPQVLPRLMLAA